MFVFFFATCQILIDYFLNGLDGLTNDLTNRGTNLENKKFRHHL